MSRKDPGRSAAPAEPDPTAAKRRRQPGEEPSAEEGNWADRAARARTADDPRAVAPHDRIGAPSTGDETLP